MTDGSGLTGSSSSKDVDGNVHCTDLLGSDERSEDGFSLLFGGEVVVEFPVIDGNGARAGPKAHPCGAGLSASGRDKFFCGGFSAHEN